MTLMLHIVDRNLAIIQALQSQFASFTDVKISHHDFFKSNYDALVSPANSFGDMSGGIDKAIDTYYKGRAQGAVQEAIANRFLGEMPVGMAIILDMNQRRNRYLIVAPTMRIPGQLPSDSINAYLAMRAALVAVYRLNVQQPGAIKKLAMPGLGTGVGGMDYEEAAKQMRTAYEQVIEGKWRNVKHPALAPYVMSG